MITLAGGIAVFTAPGNAIPRDYASHGRSVRQIYPGANAKVVADTVAAPIEQQVNGVEDMMYMSSQCTNDGVYRLTVTFHPGTDLNLAQVLVQNRVALAQPILPALVTRRGVMVRKKDPPVSADDRQLDLTRRNARQPVPQQLRHDSVAATSWRFRLSGVAATLRFNLGQRDYSMRVWLEPDKMSVRQPVGHRRRCTAIDEQNAQKSPPDQIGQRAGKRSGPSIYDEHVGAAPPRTSSSIR